MRHAMLLASALELQRDCIVRPPGHRSGVSGLVSTAELQFLPCCQHCGNALPKDVENSVKKVAILDFDVHHGQGAVNSTSV